MQAVFRLITKDKDLLASWQQQLVAKYYTSSGADPFPPDNSLPRVFILDALACDEIPEDDAGRVIILVGEPYSERFEALRCSKRVKYSLTYSDSMTKLLELAPIFQELAELSAGNSLLIEKLRVSNSGRPTVHQRTEVFLNSSEVWDFLEAALDSLGSKDRLLSEFRRASRYLLRASHVVYFLREDSVLRADRGSSFISIDDPLIEYLGKNPVVLDGLAWPGPMDPIAELAVKNRLALWGGRLIVPIHERGELLGLIVCGVREDGHLYDEGDKIRALAVARLLKQFLSTCRLFEKLLYNADKTRATEKYLPPSILLFKGEEPPRHVPLAVRALIGQVKRAKDTRRIYPAEDQPFRVSAGYIPDIGGVWAFWEESSSELYDRAQREKQDRVSVFREIALTLNHEIGNSLTSLTALKHVTDSNFSIPNALGTAIIADIGRLQFLNRELAELASLTEAAVQPTDIREVVRSIGNIQNIKVEVGPDPVILSVAPRLIDFALNAILGCILEKRDPSDLSKPVSLQLRASGQDNQVTALLSIRGKGLELEGILPEVTIESTPNHGKMGVFIGKEIIRLHQGSIHAGPGLEGTEILISLRQW